MSWGAIGGSLIGGIAGAFGARQQNKAAARLAREQMRFQERMRDTQYQAAAKDLEKAGLNRILALGGPAASPSGAMPPVVNEMAGAQDSVNSALAQKFTKEERKILRAQEDKLRAETHASTQRANTDIETQRNLKVANQKLLNETSEIQARTAEAWARAKLLDSQGRSAEVNAQIDEAGARWAERGGNSAKQIIGIIKAIRGK